MEDSFTFLEKFKTLYSFSLKYEQGNANRPNRIKEILEFYQRILDQQQNNAVNKLIQFGQRPLRLPWQKVENQPKNLENAKELTEIQKTQNHIYFSLQSIDNLLQNTNQDNWSKTDVVKLAQINEILEKLTTEQAQKVREILESQKSWKVCELLLAVHSILDKDLG